MRSLFSTTVLASLLLVGVSALAAQVSIGIESARHRRPGWFVSCRQDQAQSLYG